MDAIKLVQGKPAFTADFEKRGIAARESFTLVRTHTRCIKKIDTSKAKALEGVAAVLTWQDIPRVVYSTAGQSDPIPGPLDAFSLDNKVRFVGDRVAFVAAETAEIAEKALSLIEVEYEVLPAILDSREAMNPARLGFTMSLSMSTLRIQIPKRIWPQKSALTLAMSKKDLPKPMKFLKPNMKYRKYNRRTSSRMCVVTYWDEDDRLVIRTSTQVPFHVRRMLAPVLGLPVKTHPRHQAAHRRRLRRQAGSVDGRRGRAFDDCHQAACDLRIHPRRGIYRRALASPNARQNEDRREA